MVAREPDGSTGRGWPLQTGHALVHLPLRCRTCYVVGIRVTTRHGARHGARLPRTASFVTDGNNGGCEHTRCLHRPPERVRPLYAPSLSVSATAKSRRTKFVNGNIWRKPAVWFNHADACTQGIHSSRPEPWGPTVVAVRANRRGDALLKDCTAWRPSTYPSPVHGYRGPGRAGSC